MLILVDNTQNLKEAYMTPKLIAFLEKSNITYQLVNGCEPLSILNLENIKGVILSGGPLNLSREANLTKMRANIELFIRLPVYKNRIPVLAICFGYQLLTLLFGGEIKALPKLNHGVTRIDVDNDSVIFSGSAKELTVFNHHEDYVSEIPKGFHVIARIIENGQIQAIEHKSLPIYGVQFHPEASDSTCFILENFLLLTK